MKILLVGSTDAYFAAIRRLASLLESAGASCHVRGEAGSFAAQAGRAASSRSSRELLGADDLAFYDWIVLGVPPRVLCHTMGEVFAARRRGAGGRARVATFFPGILQERYYEALLNRASVDLLLLNSPRDERGYRHVADEFGFDSRNAFVLGHLRNQPREARALGDDALFVHQTLVPGSRRERVRLARAVVGFAGRWPGRTRVMIRAGGSRADVFALACRALSQSLPPGRLVVDHGSLADAFDDAGLCLSVASTALLEAMSRSIPAVAVADLGVRDHFGNAFYVGSRCMRRLSEIDVSALPAPSADWLADNVAMPAHRAAALMERLTAPAAPDAARAELLRLRVARPLGTLGRLRALVG